MDWRLDTIAVRMTLAVICGVVLFLAASIALVALDESDASSIQWLPARMGAAFCIIDAASPAERPRLAQALSTRSLGVRLTDAVLPDLQEESGPQAALLRIRIQRNLDSPRPTVIIGRPAVPQASGHDLVVEASLSDGRWLTFTGSDTVLTLIPFNHFAVRMGAFCLSMLAISVWSSRRLAASISDFATAAERLGVNSDAPPLAERGPRELRAAIRAFNRMQARLRRFIDDRTQMLAAMSHDLRTPLTRMRMRAEFVEDDEERQKMLKDLDAMGAMITSTLAFARDDTKRETRVMVDLAILVEDICEDFADTGADVSFSGPNQATVHCRPIAVRRALVNLVDNALKYGRNARVALAQDRDCVAITIEDSGPGIPENLQETVFAPFYRLDASRNCDTGGVGLGLAVARTIAREHGGDVTLANRPDGGLRVRLSLPL